ncbi:MAG: DUF6765 family protein [bacterium]
MALHKFADTWAGQKFSGGFNEENDVEAIYLWENKRWKHFFMENLSLDLLPEIRHAEPGYYSDLPFQKWSIKITKKNDRT